MRGGHSVWVAVRVARDAVQYHHTFASIAWVLWTERKSKQALDKDALDQAWREVPDDPHYIERRHYKERMRVEDEARAAAAKRRASDRAGSAEADSGTRGICLS